MTVCADNNAQSDKQVRNLSLKLRNLPSACRRFRSCLGSDLGTAESIEKN